MAAKQSNERIPVAVAGLGYMGREVARAVLLRPELELVGALLDVGESESDRRALGSGLGGSRRDADRVGGEEWTALRQLPGAVGRAVSARWNFRIWMLCVLWQSLSASNQPDQAEAGPATGIREADG